MEGFFSGRGRLSVEEMKERGPERITNHYGMIAKFLQERGGHFPAHKHSSIDGEVDNTYLIYNTPEAKKIFKIKEIGEGDNTTLLVHGLQDDWKEHIPEEAVKSAGIDLDKPVASRTKPSAEKTAKDIKNLQGKVKNDKAKQKSDVGGGEDWEGAGFSSRPSDKAVISAHDKAVQSDKLSKEKPKKEETERLNKLKSLMDSRGLESKVSEAKPKKTSKTRTRKAPENFTVSKNPEHGRRTWTHSDGDVHVVEASTRPGKNRYVVHAKDSDGNITSPSAHSKLSDAIASANREVERGPIKSQKEYEKELAELRKEAILKESKSDKKTAPKSETKPKAEKKVAPKAPTKAENVSSKDVKSIRETLREDLPELAGLEDFKRYEMDSDFEDDELKTWAENTIKHIDEKRNYLLGYRGDTDPDKLGRTRSIIDKKDKKDADAVNAGVKELKQEIKKVVDSLSEDNQNYLLENHPRLFKSVKGHSVLFLNENLVKGDRLSEKRKKQAFKNSFGKYSPGVSTGDTPILSKEEDEDVEKSLNLYVSV